MPKYFFDLDAGLRIFRDERGTSLPDDGAAREAAVAVVPDIIRAMVMIGETGKLTSIVRTEEGRVAFSVTLSQRCE